MWAPMDGTECEMKLPMLHQRPPRNHRWAALSVAVVLLTSAAPAALAQYQVVQDGRLFDANPSLDGGRYNFARPISPLIGGNDFATGNIGRGLSLRSFSPIQNITSFRGPLGSSSLSAFRRDSVSVAEHAYPSGGLVPRQYFDPTRTAPTAGFLSGQFGAASATPFYVPQRVRNTASPWLPTQLGAGSSPLDLRYDTRISSTGSLPAQILGLRPGTRTELSSSIFGLVAPPIRSPAERLEDRMRSATADMRRGFFRRTSSAQFERDALSRFPGAVDPFGNPRDLVERGDLSALVQSSQLPSTLYQPSIRAWDTSAAAPLPQDSSLANLAAPLAEPKMTITDPSMLPGYDVFTDMQLALTLARNPGAQWFEEMQSAIRDNPALVPELREFKDIQPDDFTRLVIETPLDTFVGRGPSAFNDALLRAESLLDIGRYYEAVARYDQALVIDPKNPLPMIGKGHALLGAGDYASAAVALLQGLEQFPDLAAFKVDLQALMGGGEIVDIRRADIMRLLKNTNQPRLRFLLGYLEYHSGDKQRGLRNLRKAAAETREIDSIISRYPNMLQPGVHLSAPRLPSSIQGGDKRRSQDPSQDSPGAPEGRGARSSETGGGRKPK